MSEKMHFVKKILSNFILLNGNGEEDSFESPDILNLKSELYIELMKNIHMWVDHESTILDEMSTYVSNSQSFQVGSEYLRPLMSHDNMEVVALRILLWCSVQIYKQENLDDDRSGEMDSYDEGDPPLDSNLVEGKDFIDISKYTNRDEE